MTQADRVLELLRQRGREGITVLDFPVGFRLSARIKDLRDAGYSIPTGTRELPSGARIARYRLDLTPTAPVPMAGEQEALPL